MNVEYELTLNFHDTNMPAMHYKSTKLDDINCQGSHWLKQFAGIRSLVIKSPDGERSIYDGGGNYLFTIPVIPSDPRIANRPDNPNWHGVEDWFLSKAS